MTPEMDDVQAFYANAESVELRRVNLMAKKEALEKELEGSLEKKRLSDG
jgi:hypothetical protein